MNAVSTKQQREPLSRSDAVAVRQLRNDLLAMVFVAVLAPVAVQETVHFLNGQPAVELASVTLTLVLAWTLCLGVAWWLASRWASLGLHPAQPSLPSLSDDDTRASLSRLTDDMARVANGDFTVRASIRQDMARPAAESFNHTVQQLGVMVGDFRIAASQLSLSVGEVQTKAEQLSQDSNYQADQMKLTSATVDEIVDSIRQVADHTLASAEVAEEARRTATAGSQSVSNTMKGMDRIRHQVQSTSKRIKQLGETSQQIGAIVQLISDVADRSSLLALNASIQASMAGDAGQGFGVVAEEVERLSKRCNVATKQIATLVKSIQSDTSQAIAGMEESIAEVVNGSRLASQAGEALADIDSVSNRLAELIDSISIAVKQQVRGGVLASRSINEIASVTQDHAVEIKQTSEAINRLASFAEALTSAVGHFQLPSTPKRPVVQPAAANTGAAVPMSGVPLPLEPTLATTVATSTPVMN